MGSLYRSCLIRVRYNYLIWALDFTSYPHGRMGDSGARLRIGEMFSLARMGICLIIYGLI